MNYLYNNYDDYYTSDSNDDEFIILLEELKQMKSYLNRICEILEKYDINRSTNINE